MKKALEYLKDKERDAMSDEYCLNTNIFKREEEKMGYWKWKFGKWKKDKDLHYLWLGYVVMLIIWYYVGWQLALTYLVIYLLVMMYRNDYTLWKKYGKEDWYK